MGPTCIYFSS